MMPLFRRLLYVSLGLIVFASTVRSGERIDLPGGIFYYRPAASVFGPEAVWVNPAALGRYTAHSWQLMADYYDKKFIKSYGAVSTGQRLGVGYRHLDLRGEQNINEYIFAFGGAFGNSHFLGASYRYLKDGPGILNKRHFWTFGLMNRLRGPFSWAAVLSNLNRGKIDGERTETEMRYSLAYQAVPGRLSLAADLFLSTKTRLSNSDYAYYAEFTPTPGLIITGYYDSDRRLQFGFKANLLHYFIGSEVRTDRDGNNHGSTIYLGNTLARQPSLIPEPDTRLSVSLGGAINENPARPVFGKRKDAFADLLLTIYRAADDPKISQMILALKPNSLGFGRAGEIREAIRYFKRQKKQVICHIAYPNNLSYYVGSAADKVYVSPVSQLNLVGLRAELKFYAGTLDKLGAKLDMMRIGDYKTAPEQYTEREASDANREQINRLLDNLYQQFVAGIAEGRGLSSDSVLTLIDNGPFTSEAALEAGLVDGLSYRDEMHKDILDNLPQISFRKYQADTVINDDWQPAPVIAVIVADGEIRQSNGSSNPLQSAAGATPSAIKAAVAQARNNPDVRGILFRINSPGGWALAAEDIYHELDKASEHYPVVVSMANIAASGGYQIAMTAERLYANPAAVTGSIGIFGGKLDLSKLYEKIDLGAELYTRGRFAGMLSATRPFTVEEREKYFSQLEAYYDHFVQLVSDNRLLSPDSIDAIARGRVWTGEEALANGLIDALGGLKEALDYMADKIGVRDYRVAIYPERRPLFLLPARPLFGLMVEALGIGESTTGAIATVKDYSEAEGEIVARLPYDLTIE